MGFHPACDRLVCLVIQCHQQNLTEVMYTAGNHHSEMETFHKHQQRCINLLLLPVLMSDETSRSSARVAKEGVLVSFSNPGDVVSL